MLRAIREWIILSIIICFGSNAVQAEVPLILKSETVDLAFGDETFAGPGAEVVNNNCLTCHSAEMILTQPVLSRDKWQATVKKMIEAYKAPVASSDISPIIDYLSAGARASTK